MYLESHASCIIHVLWESLVRTLTIVWSKCPQSVFQSVRMMLTVDEKSINEWDNLFHINSKQFYSKYALSIGSYTHDIFCSKHNNRRRGGRENRAHTSTELIFASNSLFILLTRFPCFQRIQLHCYLY